MAGERRTIALLPKGAFNIQFWFSYAAMKKNFLGMLSEKSGDILVSYHTEVHGMGSIVHLCIYEWLSLIPVLLLVLLDIFFFRGLRHEGKGDSC